LEQDKVVYKNNPEKGGKTNGSIIGMIGGHGCGGFSG
jgi:hypothetical protein